MRRYSLALCLLSSYPLAGCSSSSLAGDGDVQGFDLRSGLDEPMPPTGDAGTGEAEDAGVEGENNTAPHPTPHAPVHSACSMPLPSALPALPSINLTDAGRPKFDLWRDISCSDVSSCQAEDCSIYPDADVWCDGEGEAYSYRDGACWICAPIAAHAKACCMGEPGVDCRAWPYPGDGAPNTPCARHADCEPGLVCGSHGGSGYGLCMCPEQNGEDLIPDDSCFGAE